MLSGCGLVSVVVVMALTFWNASVFAVDKARIANSTWPQTGGNSGESGDVTWIPSLPTCHPNCPTWKFGSNVFGNPFLGPQNAFAVVDTNDGLAYVNVSNGSHIRTLNGFQSSCFPLVLDDGGLVLGTGETYVGRLSETGTVHWHVQVDDTKDAQRMGIVAIQWDPKSQDLFALTAGSILARIDSQNGSIVWKRNVKDIGGGVVFLGNHELWIGSFQGFSMLFISGTSFGALSVETGAVLWKVAGKRIDVFFGIAATKDAVYVGDSYTTTKYTPNGTVIWKYDKGSYRISAAHDMVYVALTDEGGDSKGIAALNVSCGKEVWKVSNKAMHEGWMAVATITSNLLCAGDGNGKYFVCLDRFNGSVVTTMKRNTNSGMPAPLPNGLLLVQLGDSLTVVDPYA